ncbi:DoxX family protein [soil metagenome]
MNISAEYDPSRGTGRAVMRWVLAAFYIAAGVAHLALPEKLIMIMPSWVPFPAPVIMLTGLFELAASIALLTRTPLRWWAGVTMALYALCVWPANFKQAIDGIEMPYIGNSWWYHGPRLAFQPVIVWWALYCAGAIDWPWRASALPGAKPR